MSAREFVFRRLSEWPLQILSSRALGRKLHIVCEKWVNSHESSRKSPMLAAYLP